jgi:8-hydroxy-5-deazaflavin:NADPH oxidoreductase
MPPPCPSPACGGGNTPSARRHYASSTNEQALDRETVLQGRPTIAVIGGTGDLGSALAKRWAAAGYPIVLGSRSKEKAEAAAREMNGSAVSGEDNRTAAAKADIVVIAVPYANHEAILNEIKPAVEGKIVVDTVVPLVPPKVSVVQLPPDGSAALHAQRLLGDAARVQSAFHNVSASKLKSGESIDCDVLVFGDDKDARAIVIELANAAGTRGVDGGPLANSAAAEALTSVLIGINRRYKVNGAGIRITGLPAVQRR